MDLETDFLEKESAETEISAVVKRALDKAKSMQRRKEKAKRIKREVEEEKETDSAILVCLWNLELKVFEWYVLDEFKMGITKESFKASIYDHGLPSWKVFDSRLYIFGGFNRQHSKLDHVDYFDLNGLGKEWISCSPMIATRAECWPIVMDGKIYVMGGVNLHGPPEEHPWEKSLTR